MKSSLTEYIIAVFELFEAEIKAFRQGIINLIIKIVILCVAMVILIAAVLFLVHGIYNFYLTMMLTYLASFATAGTLFVIAFILISLVRWRR